MSYTLQIKYINKELKSGKIINIDDEKSFSGVINKIDEQCYEKYIHKYILDFEPDNFENKYFTILYKQLVMDALFNHYQNI